MAMPPVPYDGHPEGEGNWRGDMKRRRRVERRDLDDRWQDKEGIGQHLGLSLDYGGNSVAAPASWGRMLTQLPPTPRFFSWISGSPELLDLHTHSCLPLHSACLGLVMTHQLRVEIQGQLC